MTQTLPRLAIIGRPNVGKSTLFNRLAGKRLALVNDQPGVTRDRKQVAARLYGLDIELIDTAGFEDRRDETSLQARMETQTQIAIDQADIILFVLDARSGVLPLDEQFTQKLRRVKKPIIVVANKCEGRAALAGAAECYALGFGEPVEISAEHGDGLVDLELRVRDLIDQIAAENWHQDGSVKKGAEHKDHEDKNSQLHLSIIGRPNAGKSTLINALIRDERLLTGPEAGITRDAIDIAWNWRGRAVKLTDTAGMRKKAKVDRGLEKLSVSDSLRSIQYGHVVGLAMEAGQAFDSQDLRLADLVMREGRALVLIITKWDLVEDPQKRKEALQDMDERLVAQARGVPLLTLSTLTGKGINRLMPTVFRQYDHWNAKIKTRDLNDWLREAVSAHPPPAVSGHSIKLRYIAQTKARPPTFVIMATRAQHLPDSYKRYLINGIRDAFELPGIPIRLIFRQGNNPYVGEDKTR